MAFLPGSPGDVINLFLPVEPAWTPSPPHTTSASSPDDPLIPRSVMVLRSNLRLQLDSLHQALAQSSPSDTFIGPGAFHFSVCFHPGFLFLDQPAWMLGLLLYVLQQSPRWWRKPTDWSVID